ncbi:MAG: Hpt domain-containing protein [Gammaproteobacteria bacterium]|nr:Hpt domain-containing protein [Gammaproteobacteria bacterium]
MTQYFDFVALGWIEKYLREEMEMALKCLKSYDREPEEGQHLRDALRNAHSATGVLRLCALDPAALLTAEIERVLGQMISGGIAGEARKLAMTELVCAIEALPAYLANVRAKREVSAGVIANVINDLRHFGNRPTLPDSLFFNPSIKPGAGISQDQQPADEARLKQFASRALRICYEFSKPALKREHEALKRLYAVGKHSTPMLAGTQMEPYFRCYMGLIEALAQPNASGDEVMVDIFKHTFVFLKSLARNGMEAVEEANPTPYIKKMLYYIARSPSPTVLQQSLRDTFGVQNVDDVRIESSGRLIQEDDLLEALKHTMSQLLEVMEFISSEPHDICASNSRLVSTIVPRLRQVGLQLKAIGLTTHAETILEQHRVLEQLSQRDEPVRHAELLDFGGALVAVKESLEHKLKHGLSAQGDSMSHDLDAAIVQQTVRCLSDMKSSINREFARKDLLQFMAETQTSDGVSRALLRPFYRAASLINDPELQQSMSEWEDGEFPAQDKLHRLAEQLLSEIPEHSYAEQAATDMEQVLSVLGLMEDKHTESAVLSDCSRYIRESVELGGLVNDAGMACFAEAIAALEQYMERCTADPLGNSVEHLDRAQARAKMLDSFIVQRHNEAQGDDNILDFDAGHNEPVILGDLDLGDADVKEEPQQAILEMSAEDSVAALAEPAPTPTKSHVVALVSVSGQAQPFAEMATQDTAATAAVSAETGLPWRSALKWWRNAEIERGPDAPPEDPTIELDEELVDCFVEEARKYIRKLEDAAPRFAAELDNEQAIMDIRAVFHTMKGSARTIEMFVFGEFMYDMEKVFNSLRDGYIQGTPDIAGLVNAVSARLPSFIDLMNKRVPFYTADFQVPHTIAAAIANKQFDADSLLVVSENRADIEELMAAEAARTSAEAAEVEAEVTQAEADATAAADRETELDTELVAEEADTDVAQQSGESQTELLDIELLEEEAVPEVEQKSQAELNSAGITRIWAQKNADVIVAYVGRILEENTANGEATEYSARALILLRALIPALVELREGEFLELDESTLAYFLDLPVIQHLASNAIFGLVDNGKGEFFKYPLSAEVIDGLQRYLDTLTEAEEEGDPDRVTELHNEVRAFVRTTLSLPEVAAVARTGTDGIPDASLQSYEVSAPTRLDNNAQAREYQQSPAGERATDVVVSLGEPLEDTEGGTPRPKGLTEQEPEAILEPAPAVVETPAPAVVEIEDEDIDLELLDLFIETLDEYFEAIDGAIAQLEEADAAGVQRLKNTLHTIKGGANSVGVRRFGAMVHEFESRIIDLEHDGDIASAAGLEKIYPLLDELHEAARFIRRQRADWDSTAAAEVPEESEPVDSAVSGEDIAQATEEHEEEQEQESSPQRVDSLRVSTGKIDRLLDTGLEISMSNVRSRRALDAALRDEQAVQGLARRVLALVDQLSLQLDTEIQAKTESVSDSEQFDPLEMDRITEKQSLAAILREAAVDLQEESQELGVHIDTAMRESIGSGRLADSSQAEMRLLRLVSFSKLGPGFRRLVHQVSRQLNKQVEFEITCGEGGLDVGVFEQIKTALEHMLRNSIDHGIDTPKERAQRGKSETGRVSLIIFRETSEFVIRLLDDGNGIDADRLRAKAVEQGIITEDEQLSDKEALRLIFHSGLSTADKVTDVSGRGVGMDVVAQSIAQVGGTVEVQSKPGFYTQFDIRIPASIMVNGALLAKIGGEEVAVPLTSLDGSDFRAREELHTQAKKGTKAVINYRGDDYELRYLGAVRGTLPIPKIDDMPEFMPVLFAHLERRRVAFFVDSVANAEELVIRSLGAQFTGVPGVAGGSLKSDGQPVLALDLNDLIRQVDYADAASETTSTQVETTTLILCVDDSVMMRRTYEKRLQSIGYEVVTAVDGVEALDYLSDATRLPDFIFTDLEMPNMNGFEFIANLRRAPMLEGIPVVVVSSRDGEKHRNEARKVGATDFMAKGANTAEGMQAVIERYLAPAAALAS